MGFLRQLSSFLLKMGLGLFVVTVAAGAPPPSTAWDDLPAVKPADDDWPWWCGPNRDNIAARGQDPPLHWSQTDNVIWKVQVPGRGHGSPCLWGDAVFLADGLLYMVEDLGKVACFEARTGNEVWTSKLEGEFSSSPVLANGHVYVVNEEGVAFVFKAGRQFELVARNDLGDGGFATPVICGDRIYLRTLHWLYCLGKSE